MQSTTIGIIGCGAMGSTLARGFVREAGVSPAQLYVFDLSEDRVESLVRELAVQPAASYGELCRESEIVFVAVKPQDIDSFVNTMQEVITPAHLLVSIAAGITTGFLEKSLKCKVVRLMPNTPCLVGEGAIAISAGSRVDPAELDRVEELLQPLGMTIRVPERMMEAVTGFSGSGPAFVFLLLEAFIDGGVEVGMTRDVASVLAIQTFLGAAAMIQKNPRHPAVLKNAVTSPGGTASAGLRALEEGAVRASIIKAVAEATRRAGELKRE